ncbi:filamentous hemagglutinin [Caballeronia terrestris]|uniref:Filamentous hemagglutinin n=1 Tax=Caballeronia terrestris TaxID=1226301 RepID=A0A158IS27_9BURK|nr:filamentous hemagglutinin [Caballeronia terrestris]
MNKNNYRLVYSRLRGMLVAVAETATASGKEAGQATLGNPKSQGVILSSADRAPSSFLRQIVFAALVLLGALPSWSVAQIVPGGAHAPSVDQTHNGIPQVNINRPSNAGVSMNTYGRFDVQKNGAILNNSPVFVQTQQAGMVNGNRNLAPGQTARIIVNQVNSSAASQINGHLEIAGQRAEVVIANGSGISVNGGGFINTSRAILTTGTPNFAPDGSLAGFTVTRGNISIQGAGLDARDTDQVDLLARAVRANAAIHAQNLNVVSGANSVEHATLNARPVAGEGPAPGVSIDVSHLGGMYANRIVLAGTEHGVGVSTQGVLAAQAGDLTLTTQGKLVLAGQTNASGNLALSALEGIDNSGTTYAQQNLTARTSGALANSSVLAAQQSTTVNAASVVSTGTLASGVDSNGHVTQAGDLNVAASGALSETGENVAGGNATLTGSSVNLAGSKTAANGRVALTANAGDLNLAGATTSAGSVVTANAAGTLNNDHGSMTGGSGVTLGVGAISNQAGQISAQGPLVVQASGQIANQGGTFVSQGAMQVRGGAIANNQGTMQSAVGLGISGSSLDNTAGHILSLNGDGLSLGITGTLLNGISGVIGGNGRAEVSAHALTNAGRIAALTDAVLQAWNLGNSGQMTAGGVLTATATGALSNAGGTFSGGTVTVSGASIDNSRGDINGDTVSVTAAGNLTNRRGRERHAPERIDDQQRRVDRRAEPVGAHERHAGQQQRPDRGQPARASRDRPHQPQRLDHAVRHVVGGLRCQRHIRQLGGRHLPVQQHEPDDCAWRTDQR